MAEALMKDYRILYINAGGHVMVDSPGGVQGTTVNIKTTKSKIRVMPAEGTLGSDAVRRNYVKHLIDRYNEFASKQDGRTKFTYAAIYAQIKRRFKADWERVPLGKFDELVSLLHARVDATQLGRINRGKGVHNYSAFEEYQRDYGS